MDCSMPFLVNPMTGAPNPGNLTLATMSRVGQERAL